MKTSKRLLVPPRVGRLPTLQTPVKISALYLTMTLYTPKTGLSFLLIPTFAVGNPIVLPICLPLPTFPLIEKGLPKKS